ncbi:MFS transporter [Planktothrix sp. FACHB-1355]|uniref:MFS transporter n=1 Tax=Aerosakkonema funiforme FACHB-1375 TaxID=2949571 RepID=A0A926VKX3_9CYAN|nr:MULTISPECIES: MFS transporter [Oscillatoriales]MBD2185701.1 MFS transporter [Aerosakkonema funiforme FACHB-1375]MBD3562926.1 MFS transporter [Planktothrix sp. FACHB-1355]
MDASRNQPNVLWLQVWGLAGVQGAITLTWLIYNLYLPQLLVQFGFAKELAAGLLIIENALAIAMEPLMGGISDRIKHSLGSRFPLISVGVILSSALFIAIPAVVVFRNLFDGIRWVLLLLMVGWALAMAVFRSPAISLLGKYARPAELPLAASLLTLAAGIIGAFKPIANQFVLGMGPIFSFAIGTFVLLGAAAILRRFDPPEIPQQDNTLPVVPSPSLSLLSPLLLILGTGAGVAWGSRFLMDAMPKMLKNQWQNADIPWLMFAISLFLAFAALPAGALAVKLGNQRAMLIGIGATIPLLLLMVLIPNWFIVAVTILGALAFFALIVNGVVPFALSLVPTERSGLGVGFYFGGIGLGSSLFGILFPQLASMTAVASGIWGAIAFLVAAICIAASGKLRSVPEAVEA